MVACSRSSSRGYEIGYVASNMIFIILMLVGGVIFLVVFSSAANELRETWLSYGGTYGDFLALGPGDYLIKPLLSNISGPLKVISGALEDALKEMLDAITGVIKGFFIVMAVLLAGTAGLFVFGLAGLIGGAAGKGTAFVLGGLALGSMF